MKNREFRGAWCNGSMFWAGVVLLVCLGASCSESTDHQPISKSPGSGGEPDLPMSRDISIAFGANFDKTGVQDSSDYAAFEENGGRISLRWWEHQRSDYLAYIQDQETGDTLRVMFEGATKKGVAEISFQASALPTGRPCTWFLTRKTERDTLQRLEILREE
ncbi:MAG: hypothetical protein ACPGYK_06695 [Flavobacteriales bacterium]